MNIDKYYYNDPINPKVHMDLHIQLANNGFLNPCETIGVNKQ